MKVFKYLIIYFITAMIPLSLIFLLYIPYLIGKLDNLTKKDILNVGIVIIIAILYGTVLTKVVEYIGKVIK